MVTKIPELHFKSFYTGSTSPSGTERLNIDADLHATKFTGDLSGGKIGSTSGLMIKTTTSGALTTLPAGTSGQYLQYDGTWSTPPDSNTNYYPTTFTWTNGTTSGPTGSLTGSGMSAVSYGAIPSASGTVSGVVTTGDQTFAGAKTFTNQLIIQTITNGDYNEGIRINKSSNNYATLLLGGNANTTNGSPSTNGGWWVACNPANQFVVSRTVSTVGDSGFYLDTSSNMVVKGTVTAPTFSGALTGNAATATKLSTTRLNWVSNATYENVVGQLAWKNYGIGHTIFDASGSISPDGTSINNTVPEAVWAPTYPTLMGWNGSNTYGLRTYISNTTDAIAGVSCYTGTTAPTLSTRVNVDGYLYATRVYNAVYNDYAECFDNTDLDYDKVKNRIVEITDDDKVRLGNNNSIRVVGVVSDSYGHMLGGTEEEIENGKKVPVGIAGKLYVDSKDIVDINNIGKFVGSDDEGYAKVLSDDFKSGTVVGKIIGIDKENNRYKLLLVIK